MCIWMHHLLCTNTYHGPRTIQFKGVKGIKYNHMGKNDIYPPEQSDELLLKRHIRQKRKSMYKGIITTISVQHCNLWKLDLVYTKKKIKIKKSHSLYEYLINSPYSDFYVQMNWSKGKSRGRGIVQMQDNPLRSEAYVFPV